MQRCLIALGPILASLVAAGTAPEYKLILQDHAWQSTS